MAAASKKSKNGLLKRQWPFKLGLPQLRPSYALALIFVLVFANVGTVYMLRSKAATYQVRFVLFCAKDKCSGSTTTLDGHANKVRSWYKSSLGRTFNKATTVKITGYKYAADYNNGTRSASENTIINIKNELVSRKIIVDNYTKYVIQLGFKSMSNCGIGYQGGVVAMADPLYGCSSRQPTVLAHELGHNLSIARTSTYHRSDYTLMHAPYACNGADLTTTYCKVNSTDKSYLQTYQKAFLPVL